MKRRTVLVASALPLLWSCASKPKKPNLTFIKVKPEDYARTVQEPPLNVVRKANVGDVILSSHRVAVMPSLRLMMPASADTAHNDKWLLQLKLKPTEYLLVATDDAGGHYYAPMDALPTTYVSVEPGKKESDGPDNHGGIFVSSSGQAHAYLMQEEDITPSALVPLDGLRFERTTVEADLPGEHIQKELLFAGTSGSTAVMRYREFWRGANKPESSLEVRYDIARSKSAGYQDARFEILEASNLGITYSVQASLK